MNNTSKIIMLSLLTLTNAAFAGQQKDVKDRDMVTLTLSSKDPNIVALINDRINKYTAVKGVATASIDTKDGFLNVKPAGIFNDRPFSMIIFTEKGYRYTLLLVPKKIPAQDIVLNNEQILTVNKNPLALYSAKIANLVKAMIKDGKIKDYKKEIIEQDISTNQQELISVVNYVGNDLKGEILVYKNLSSNDKSLREQAFYGTNVIAVAISNKDLKPFEITKIYRVVKNG